MLFPWPAFCGRNVAATESWGGAWEMGVTCEEASYGPHNPLQRMLCVVWSGAWRRIIQF